MATAREGNGAEHQVAVDLHHIEGCQLACGRSASSSGSGLASLRASVT
jgi:hypothetical protein